MTITAHPVALSLTGRPAFVPTLGQMRVVVESPEGGPIRVAPSNNPSAVADAPDAIVLPVIGEPVSVDGAVGVWLGAVPGDVSSGQITAWLLAGAIAREMSRPAAQWDVRECVTGASQSQEVSSLVALANALEQAHLLRGDLERQRLAHARWREGLVEDLHAEADRRDFCSDFDDWMSDHDMPGRSREWSVAVDVTKRIYVTVSASNVDDACEAVDSYMVREALRFVDVDGDDWETDEDDTDRS